MIQQTPISTLADLIRDVRAVISGAGDTTPLPIGRAFLKTGVGAPPRWVVVPEGKGKWSSPTRIGAGLTVASVTHACKVYIRGAEGATDDSKSDAAYELADRMINALRVVGSSCVEGGDYDNVDPADSASYGAEVILSFRFTRQVARDHKIWNVPATPVSPIDPMRPAGDSGKSFVLDPTTTGAR